MPPGHTVLFAGISQTWGLSYIHIARRLINYRMLYVFAAICNLCVAVAGGSLDIT